MALTRSSLETCFEKGLLRKIPPSKANALASIRAAYEWQNDAKKTLKAKAFRSTIIATYNAMFHAARAHLFLDGYREKSHVCVARYLDATCVKTKRLESKWVALLNHYRNLRHCDQYSLGITVTKKEAEQAVGSAQSFVERLEALLEERMKKEERI